MNGQIPPRSMLWKCLQVFCWVMSSYFFDLKIYGKKNIPRSGGALLLANHQSYLDPVLIAVKLDRPVSYMAKTELFEGNRFFKWLITSLHAFPVRRGESDVSAIKLAISKLQEGNILNMYPEGTRTRNGEIGKILPGVAVVVRRAQVPVIPVIIDGSFQAFPKGGKALRPYPIRIMYGKPLKIEGLKGDQIVELIDKTLRQMFKELRSQREHS